MVMPSTTEESTIAPKKSFFSGGKPREPRTPFLERYRSWCYRVVGNRLEGGGGSDVLAERLKQVGINATPGMHRGVRLMTMVLAGGISAPFAFVLFWLLIHSPIWYLWVAIIAAVAVGAVAAGFSILISTRLSNRKTQLERELPFSLSELSVLASTGVSPIELVRRMARRDHDPGITAEFRKVQYKAEVQGKDLITAFAETAKESPSNALRESFWDLANMIHQGGNLDDYLRGKSDEVLNLKRSVQKEFIERLSTFLDMYVSLVVIGVLMIAVGAFLINSFGSTAAGLDANELLLLLTFGLVPVAVAMTVVLISMAWSRVE